MKRLTRDGLMIIVSVNEPLLLSPQGARDALDSDARQRAEIRRLKAHVRRKDKALRGAVAEFKRRNESPWLPTIECEEALKPLEKGKR